MVMVRGGAWGILSVSTARLRQPTPIESNPFTPFNKQFASLLRDARREAAAEDARAAGAAASSEAIEAIARAAVDEGEVQRVADRLLRLWVSALRERHGVDIGTPQPQPPPPPAPQERQRRGRGLPPLRWTSPPRSPVISTARRRQGEVEVEGEGDHDDEEGSAGGGVVGEGEERKPLVGLVGMEAPAGLPQTFMVHYSLSVRPPHDTRWYDADEPPNPTAPPTNDNRRPRACPQRTWRGIGSWRTPGGASSSARGTGPATGGSGGCPRRGGRRGRSMR